MMRKLLVVVLLATTLAAMPAGSAMADQPGFRSAIGDRGDRIHPFNDGAIYCASQDLGVWFYVVDASRKALNDFMSNSDAEFLLDNEPVDITRAAIKKFARSDVVGFEWITAIGDPSVGPLAIGTHALESTFLTDDAVTLVLSIEFTVEDC